MTDYSQLASALHEYIRFRAGKENVNYNLSPQFFVEHLRRGARTFFGVECEDGALIADHQFPNLFEEWRSE
jgi:hypothetical protein